MQVRATTMFLLTGGATLVVIAVLAVCIGIVAYAAVKWTRSKK